MKCTNCGGRLEGAMTICPFCQVRQDIDLRKIHFRDLGCNAAMPCPECQTPLSVVEFDLTPPVSIDRCQSCYGLFFNPGELEYLIDAQVNPVVWVDMAGLNQITADFDTPREIVYRRCPICRERMSHLNFGGRSGVILDRCGTHGLWVDGGKFRRLTEWWRVGGKHLHQNQEAERAKVLRTQASPDVAKRIESVKPMEESSTVSDSSALLEAAALVIAWIND